MFAPKAILFFSKTIDFSLWGNHSVFSIFSLFSEKRLCLWIYYQGFSPYTITSDFFTSFSKEPSPKKSKGQVMMLSKSKWRRPYFLTFYVKDNQLHLMLPLVFFLGLFEAFMSKTFLTVSALISNFLWTGSSHQTLDKHEKLKFLNVGTWCISVKPNSVLCLGESSILIHWEKWKN